jgi:cytochrome c oxidase subunit II
MLVNLCEGRIVREVRIHDESPLSLEKTTDGITILLQQIKVPFEEKRFMRSLLFAPLSLAAILSLTSGTVSRRSKPAQTSTQDVKVIEVNAKKYEYNPSSIHVKQGTKVQLRITATDHTHGFKIGAFSDGSDQNGSPGLAFTSPQDCWKIEKGQSSTIEFVAQTTGTYSFKCCVKCGLGHGGMKGQLIVDP